jgi:hypothetical protein
MAEPDPQETFGASRRLLSREFGSSIIAFQANPETNSNQTCRDARAHIITGRKPTKERGLMTCQNSPL